MTAKKVAIVGTGLIGRAWAITFARGGCAVQLYDSAEGKALQALDALEGSISELGELDLLQGQTPATVLSRISVATRLQEAAAEADYVQENSPEILEVKRQVFAELDALASPETLLASSTSGFLASSFTETLDGRHRCFVAHPLNPPFLTPAVELVPAPWTDPSVMQRARAFLESVGQAPLSLTREIEGFVMNRLQSALLHEAFRLVAEGYATAADVDRAVGQGLGLRWSFMGPFETIDLNAPDGIRDYVDRYGSLYQRIAETQMHSCDWQKVLDDGVAGQRRSVLPVDAIGERQRWRDHRMMALAAHKLRSDEELGQ